MEWTEPTSDLRDLSHTFFAIIIDQIQKSHAFETS